MTNVLIVAGNKLVRWSLKEILAQEGLRAEVYQESRDSLEKIAKDPFSLIIIDHEVRKIDNINILEKIDEFFPSTSIIVLSSLVEEQREALLKRPNVFLVIEKPFSVAQIKDAVLAALSSPRLNDGKGIIRHDPTRI